MVAACGWLTFCRGKKFNDQTIPQRPQLTLEVLERSLALLGYGTTVPTPALPTFRQSQRNGQPPKLAPTPSAVPTPSSVPTPPTFPATVVSNKAKQLPAPLAPPSEPIATSQAHLEISPRASTAHKSASPVPLPSASVPKATASGTNGSTVAIKPIIEQQPVQVTPPSEAKDSLLDKEAVDKTDKKNRTDNITPPVTLSNAPESLTGPPSASLHVPDAVSSPGSSAPSVTTAAVDDASTGTSPDNEGPNYNEPIKDSKESCNESKEKEGGEELPRATDIVGEATDGPVESAEDQLLQEASRLSADAVTSPQHTSDLTTVEPAASKEPTSAEEPLPSDAPPTVEQDAPISNAETVAPPEPPKAPKNQTNSDEIPDSREDTPNQMDVDVSDTEPRVPGETFDSEEQGSADKASITPALETSTHKEESERTVTTVLSSVTRPKSVDEVGGSTNPTSNNNNSLHSTENLDSQLTPLKFINTPQSLNSRIGPTSGRKARPRPQISAVLFGKQPKRTDGTSVMSTYKEQLQLHDDYYTPLFVQGFAQAPGSWMHPLERVLMHANKTIATPDANLCIQDHQACKVLRRVYHLQSNDKWSLRQPKRSAEPIRPPSHWDTMIKEVKWMRTDFREERKWKMAAARNLANACALWCLSSLEGRKDMQVSAIIPPRATSLDDMAMADGAEDGTDSQATPDLVHGESPQAMDELVEDMFPETISPSAIFTLQDDDVVFGLRRTPASDQLLEELPMYGAPLKVPRSDPTAPEFDPDAHWRRPALPLSKYVEGQMKLVDDGPPRKRSRFSYRNEDSDDEDDGGFVSQHSQRASLPPDSTDCALFSPDMKHIRDRLHAGHQFRPPTDHPMPTQSFYECRNASQWTVSEDDELRALVREYSYNWPHISSMLVSRSLFTSGAERRTPWECFERWIQLEGLPSDMQKTQYFKAYNARIEAAQRVIQQQYQLAAQQATAAGAAVPPRKRYSTPMRVERRRQQKHLTLLDAMRKLAKKRETTLHKQQQVATQNASNKKPQDAIMQATRSGPTKTPREYSILRWERDRALAEKMAQVANRQGDVTRRVSATPTDYTNLNCRVQS